MSYSNFNRLFIGELRPTNIYLRLTSHFVNYPFGIFYDISIKVGDFYAHFVILDMVEDTHI